MPFSKLRMASKNRLYGSIEWLRWVYRMALRMASTGLQNGFDGCTDRLYGFREWLRWVYRMALRMASMGPQTGFMALKRCFDGSTDWL